jgi:predicted 2-oxoglutarate/Fe(II)-dependent dioxygenase YbiX
MIYQEKIFSKKECKEIIDLAKNYKLKALFDKNSGIAEDTTSNRIESNSYSMNRYDIMRDSENEWIFNKLLNWFTSTTNIQLNDTNLTKWMVVHKYTIGDKFDLHIDISEGKESILRRYNVGLQLNDEYDGGEYILYDIKNNPIILSKESGTAITYKSTVPHEIKEITKGERWSIIMMIHKDEILEKKQLI